MPRVDILIICNVRIERIPCDVDTFSKIGDILVWKRQLDRPISPEDAGRIVSYNILAASGLNEPFGLRECFHG